MSSRRAVALLVAMQLTSSWAIAQDLDFHPPASATDPSLPVVMRDLAIRVLPVYQESDTDRYLRNLSALQIVGRNYPAAWQSRQELLDRHRNADVHHPAQAVARSVIVDIYAHARSREAQDRTPFPRAFAQSYWDVVSKLSDQDSYTLEGWLAAPTGGLQEALQRSLDQWRSKGSIPLAEAVELASTYLSFDAYRSFHALVAGLNAEDDGKRYVIDWDVLIRAQDGASISAVVVRPKDDTKPVSTLLEFTINVDTHNFAKESAAHGYAGIVAFTRGERRSPGKIVPYEHDGEDARSVIEWIAKQPWSDGKVGMYGTSYSGFTAWAAAKRLPSALKAIAITSATAPGIDFPMEDNIVHNWAYRWSGCVSGEEGFDEKTCNDDARWREVNETWYASGKSYRDLDRALGGHSLIFHRWLDHPSYDRYWQKLIPYRKQFSRIEIPVLATSGYYAGGEAATLYYFRQHYKYLPHANQTLLIGPYDDGVMQHGVQANLMGLPLDQSALIDMRELRYQWFDYVLKGAEKPALLQQRVNFQIMGANDWGHAASLESLDRSPLRFYLDAAPIGADGHRLTQRKPAEAAFTPLIVPLADRTDAAWTPLSTVMGKTVPLRNGVMFVSDPLRHPLEFSGLLSGRLDFLINKMDVDLTVTVYEQLPSGDYLALFDPPMEIRASYVNDPVNRHLLQAGERQQLTFKSDRMTSRKLDIGSRLIVALGVNKRPDEQINYGTGTAVNEETIADGRVPVKIRWYGDSYVDIPARK